jgi:hypothetical protein
MIQSNILDNNDISLAERLLMAKEIIQIKDLKIARLEALIADMNSDKDWQAQSLLGGTM